SGVIRRWDLTGGVDKIASPQRGAVLAVAFSADGKQAATLAGVNLEQWDGATAKLLNKTDVGDPVCAAFAPEADLLAVQTVQKMGDFRAYQVRLLRASTGHAVKVWPERRQPFQRLCLSGDGRTLALVDPDHVLLWDGVPGNTREKRLAPP